MIELTTNPLQVFLAVTTDRFSRLADRSVTTNCYIKIEFDRSTRYCFMNVGHSAQRTLAPFFQIKLASKTISFLIGRLLLASPRSFNVFNQC